MDSTKNLSIVFALIIFLLICMWMFSFYFLNTIAGEVTNLYFHPYAVSNAARNININLVSMHRYMKDVALAENEEQLTLATGLVGDHEQQALRRRKGRRQCAALQRTVYSTCCTGFTLHLNNQRRCAPYI